MTGVTGRIEGLAWRMRREGPLYPSMAKLNRVDDRTLTLTTDVVRPDSKGRYYITDRVFDFTLRRAG